jgi:hypothetical protein
MKIIVDGEGRKILTAIADLMLRAYGMQHAAIVIKMMEVLEDIEEKDTDAQ